MAVFESFSDLLAFLFSKDPAGYRIRKELKETHKFLRMLKPAIYKVSGNRILPAFAVSVFAVASALRPLRDILDKSVTASDARIARRYRDFLIERRLGKGAVDLLESCSYEAMVARSSAGLQPSAVEAAASAASEDFRLFLKGLEGGESKVIDAELAELEGFIEFCRYDYSRLLAHFDPSVNLDSSAYKPAFDSVDGAIPVPDLVDFHSVLGLRQIGSNVIENLVFLAERIGGEYASDARRKIPKAIARVNKLLQGAITTSTLTALLRAVRSDPRYLPPASEPFKSPIPEYRERAEKRFREDRDRLLHETKENALASDIAALFGAGDGKNGPLLPVAGYDRTVDEKLRREASRSFTWMMALGLMKTFDAKFLSAGIVEAGRRLVVEGFFNNGAVRSRLTDAVTRLEKCGARIAAFEEAAGSQGRSGTPALVKHLADLSNGKDTMDAIDRIIAGMDERAKDIVERDVMACKSLAEVIFDVIADFKKPTPDLVSNIKTLAASKTKDLIPSLANGYNAIARFLKIMKTFMIVSSKE